MRLVARARAFQRQEDGALIIFSIYMLLAMLMALGMAVDTVRYEYTRAQMQNTLDRAVLAAASLDQELPPKQVVRDYFDRADLGHLISDKDIDVKSDINSRTVSAVTNAKVATLFMDLVGIKSLTAPASGTATESIGDLEIALVLDNSGSMNSTRMGLLKPAARNFIDAVVRDNTKTDSTTAISIVPFATQVSAGPVLMSHINTSEDHDYSHCVTFEDADFRSVSLSETKEYKQTGHFDRGSIYGSNDAIYQTPSDSNLVCPVWESRDITPWSTNATYLKGRIDAMQAAGWTSIEVGAKWGAALLDPSMRDALTDMIDDKKVDEVLRGQPFDYNRPATMKVMVVMSDGANTSQFDIREGYRSGKSPLYAFTKNGTTYYSYYHDQSGNKDYWRLSTGNWHKKPHGKNKAKQLTWPEVWDTMRVEYFTDFIKAPALGGSDYTYYHEIVDSFYDYDKNERTSEICRTAKNEGVTIFTIGMDTYGQGDETLRDCATDEAYFYDVRSMDISKAFSAIERQINALRLTQ